MQKTKKKKGRVLRAILIILLCLLLLAAVGLSIAGAYSMSYPEKYTLDAVYQKESQHGNLRDYDSWEKVEYTVSSFDGYEIHCEYLPNPEESDKFLIVSHGILYARYGSVQYCHFFREHGYNCIIYDDRAHGENEKTAITYGVRESKDLIAIIDDLHDTFGDDIRIGLHGESMGTALSILSLQYDPDIEFIIADCGYAELSGLIETQFTAMTNLPTWLLKGPSLASKVLFGFSYYEVNPIECLKDNDVPICFMHGKNDALIPYTDSVRMHKANKGYSELHIFDGAGHTASWPKNKDEYEQIEEAFLDTIDPTLL